MRPPRKTWPAYVAIVIAGLSISAFGQLGMVFFLRNSFDAVADAKDQSPDEIAPVLARSINAAIISNVLVLVGLLVLFLGPLAYWLLSRRRRSSIAPEGQG